MGSESSDHPMIQESCTVPCRTFQVTVNQVQVEGSETVSSVPRRAGRAAGRLLLIVPVFSGCRGGPGRLPIGPGRLPIGLCAHFDFFSLIILHLS